MGIQAFNHSSKIILFVRAPVLGYVKTRLAKEIGENRALTLYKSFISDVLEAVKETMLPFILFFTPQQEKGKLIDFLGEQYHYEPQLGNNLGERISNAFKYVFESGIKKAILIGSDTVDITKEELVTAFETLNNHDVVIGPAFDGGFYLVGFNKESFKERYFHNINWSSDVTRLNLMNNLREIKSIALLDMKMDIDTVDNLFMFYTQYKDRQLNLKTLKAIDALKIFC